MRSRLKPNEFGSFHEYLFVQTGEGLGDAIVLFEQAKLAMVKCMRLIIGELGTKVCVCVRERGTEGR